MSDSITFSSLELDALQETMNIGFGQAAAALSEVIDLHVVLHVPKITQIDSANIADFVQGEIDDPAAYSMVEQFFFGRFSGTSFLVLPEKESRKLVELFQIEATPERDAQPLDSLEKEIVIEIGNIIIGACVGKVAEILRDIVSYEPPRYITGPIDRDLIHRHLQANSSLALVFKTLFHFERQDVVGLLFLVTGEDSTIWLKRAVDEMIQSLS
ncbi:MAG TPA: chemotaxis protein CheC [Spirochaetaceae bacterium]|nr:chemotaxis protein CheC [Spirochaetaceae bacterium]HAW85424.1 chemotaxis protein CheC [Spirochaetaceae bacterium]HAX37434.1 chemotaxis protein CheC [Spirochaetaceae bacterium]HBO41176.1 chemotaxis protein CheC [Spirochaetaceae bacterium]